MVSENQTATSVVILGFASFSDRSFELIVRNRDGLETTLCGHLTPGQLEIVDRILPTCVYVDAECKSA
jgi:hypothetical protein